MYTVGLTGGIGSGKSLVAGIFSHLGIRVFNSDRAAAELLDEDPEVRDQLIRWFGSEIYTEGKPNRQKLAGILFTDPEKLARMNGLIHPLVLEKFRTWCTQNRKEPYLLHEAAILFETGFYKYLNTTILVTAPENIRISRVKKRDRTSEESIRRRMQNQWTDEQKTSLAGFIILNDGDSPLLPAILEIHDKLLIKSLNSK
jgi:dephospho-CoA kinase